MNNPQHISRPGFPKLKIHKLNPLVQLPRRCSAGAAGYDIYAFLMTEGGRASKTLVAPNSSSAIPTGLMVEPPQGYFLFLCPRSGLGKYSISVTNSPGIIDPDYRGELKVLVYNGSYVNFWIEHGMRIAQLVVMPLMQVEMLEVEMADLSPTSRGTAGFGSTGS